MAHLILRHLECSPSCVTASSSFETGFINVYRCIGTVSVRWTRNIEMSWRDNVSLRCVRFFQEAS